MISLEEIEAAPIGAVVVFNRKGSLPSCPQIMIKATKDSWHAINNSASNPQWGINQIHNEGDCWFSQLKLEEFCLFENIKFKAESEVQVEKIFWNYPKNTICTTCKRSV